MKSNDRVKYLMFYVVFVLAGLIAGLAFNGRAAGRALAFQDGTPPDYSEPGAGDAPIDLAVTNGEVGVVCTPAMVVTYLSRVEVRCIEVIDGISVFAADVKDPYHADRVLSMLTAAEIEHHGLLIFFDPNDLSGIKYGCPEAFCRPIRAVSLFD